MKFLWIFFVLLFCCCEHVQRPFFAKQIKYAFTSEPIDVVIPSIEKDLATLNLCIAGIKSNCAQVRRIIVVSAKKLTNEAEWFDEAKFPFSKMDCARELSKGDQALIDSLIQNASSRVGWYYQQLLKLYSPFVIPGMSSNVLILDSDTIFLNSVEFMNNEQEGLYNPGVEYNELYFKHAKRLLWGFHRVFPEYSGVSHHMLFQRAVLQGLFHSVERQHKLPFWKAFCRCVKKEAISESSASEYEIYFNFVFNNSAQPHLRFLKWMNITDLSLLQNYKEQGYHYVSCHSYSR